jgi:hypothetical protein
MYQLSKTQENKLFKGESITIKPSQLMENGKEYFTSGHNNKIMRKLQKGKGHRVKLSKADYKHLRSKSMQGSGFMDWLRKQKDTIVRKSKNTGKDLKNMVSRDADTRNNAWKKVGMKAANKVAKTLVDKTPIGKIPVVSGIIDNQIDKGFKKAAEKAGIQGYGHKKDKKIEFKMKPKEHDIEGEGIMDDVSSYIASKGKDYIAKNVPKLKNKAKEKAQQVAKKVIDKVNPYKVKAKKKAAEIKDVISERANAIENSEKASNLKLSLQKLIDDIKQESSGSGLRLDRRGHGLRLSRGGQLRNVDLISPSPNVPVFIPNVQSDFLPSNSQAMNGAMADQVFYGDMMSNSIFAQRNTPRVEVSSQSYKSDILNPYLDHSDHAFVL